MPDQDDAVAAGMIAQGTVATVPCEFTEDIDQGYCRYNAQFLDSRLRENYATPDTSVDLTLIEVSPSLNPSQQGKEVNKSRNESGAAVAGIERRHAPVQLPQLLELLDSPGSRPGQAYRASLVRNDMLGLEHYRMFLCPSHLFLHSFQYVV